MEISKKEFGQAIFEGICQMQEELLANCRENANCSSRHRRILKIIVRKGVSPSVAAKISTRKKALVAALVAAILALTGCTAYAFRNEIKGLLKEYGDGYIHVRYDGENVQKGLTQAYYINYIPEGYELVAERRYSSLFTLEYENSDGEFIYYDQMMMYGGKSYMNTEAEFKELEIKGAEKDIYYVKIDDLYKCMWNDGIHAFYLYFSEEMTDEELLKILRSIN